MIVSVIRRQRFRKVCSRFDETTHIAKSVPEMNIGLRDEDSVTFPLGEFENSCSIILGGEESTLDLVDHSQANENALQLVAVVDLRAKFAGASVGGLGFSGAVAFGCHIKLTE